MGLKQRIAALPPDRVALFWQIFRYLLTGGFITAIQAATYWLLAAPMGMHPQAANFIGYLVAVALGYVLHRSITFRGHGSGERDAGRMARFVAVSLISYALNALWVWFTTGWIGWADWTPIPLMVFVTPGVVFTLNRQWVFR